jgi:hypothetical protein
MMKVMANKLKYRAHLYRPIQTPNDSGGFDRTFEDEYQWWCEIENESVYIKSIRGEQIQEGVTHILKSRWMAVKNFGKAFTSGFSAGFDNIRDVNCMKNNHYIFIQESVSYRGRLFKIEGMIRDEQFREWARIQVHEELEMGAGAVV